MKTDFKSAKKDASRQAILDAAEVCVCNGKPLQVAALAEEAGIAVGTVYRYFDGKQDLEQSLIGRMVRSLVDHVDQAVAAEGEAGANLEALIRAIFDSALSHPGALRLFLERSTWSQLGTDHDLGDHVKPAYQRYDELELRILRRLKLCRIPEDQASRFLRASMLAGLTFLADLGDDARREGVENLVRLSMQGLMGCVEQ
jgi:AcrR family transcriptional regulator